jgi:hypothetical protein
VNPNEVASHLLELARQLDAAVKELGRLDSAAVHARSRFEVTYADAFLSADGAMDMKKQRAILATEDEKYTAEMADHLVRVQRELIRAIGTRIEVGRTVSATVRSEISLAGVGT